MRFLAGAAGVEGDLGRWFVFSSLLGSFVHKCFFGPGAARAGECAADLGEEAVGDHATPFSHLKWADVAGVDGWRECFQAVSGENSGGMGGNGKWLFRWLKTPVIWRISSTSASME